MLLGLSTYNNKQFLNPCKKDYLVSERKVQNTVFHLCSRIFNYMRLLSFLNPQPEIVPEQGFRSGAIYMGVNLKS